MDPIVLSIEAHPQRMVDDTCIAAMTGLTRRVHALTKPVNGPVLASSEPWEGKWLAPAGVAFDADLGLWRMWYSSTGARDLEVPGARHGALHLAVSADGIVWEKSPLGLCKVAGSRDNNLCIWEDGRPMVGARTVLDEPDDPDPTKRYKLLYYPGYSYYLAYSADGLRWRPAQEAPVWVNGAGDGLEETSFFFHDPLSGKYRGHMRIWRRHQTIRLNGLGESDDLLSWTGPFINFNAQPAYGTGAQVYGMHVHADGGLYWAFPWICYTGEPLDESLQESIRFRLAWSRDGSAWHPLAPDRDIMPMGQRGRDFDWGMVLTTCPAVFTAGEGRLYYFGCNNLHDDSNPDTRRSIGLATWRQGGLVGLAADEDGALLTHRFLFRGQELRLDARTQAGGRITAELLHDGGGVIPGHRTGDSDPFTGDDGDHLLTWNGRGDLAALYGQSLMLRLRLHQAEVFAFRAAGPAERFAAPLGPPPVRIGRVVTPPVIDGVLDDTCWQDFNHTGVACDFVDYRVIQPADVKTRVLVTRDEASLYLGIECEEPEAEALAALPPTNRVNYHRDECLELRLSGPSHGSGIYVHQLMLTAGGATEHNCFSKEAGGTRGGLTGPWTTRVKVATGRWCAELAVPFATLEAPPPAPGERWRFNLIRHRHLGGDTTSCWVCTFGSVHRTDLAGDLVFS